ncbi:MAG: hypothetical protein ACOYVK_05475 [Bacillota bacterium]
MNYYFLFHYYEGKRYFYLVQCEQVNEVKKEFMKMAGETNPHNIVISKMTIIKEFRGSEDN